MFFEIYETIKSSQTNEHHTLIIKLKSYCRHNIELHSTSIHLEQLTLNVNKKMVPTFRNSNGQCNTLNERKAGRVLTKLCKNY